MGVFRLVHQHRERDNHCDGGGPPAERGSPLPFPRRSTRSRGGVQNLTDDREGSDEARALDTAALAALWGFSADWQADLVSLLRSNVPISPAVREALADAIQGTSPFGATLKLDGHGALARRMEDLEARREWFIAAPFVAYFLDSEGKTESGFMEASETLQKSESYCRNSYYYHKNANDWIDSVRGKGRFYSRMNDEELAQVWHLSSIRQKTKKPNPPSPEEFDRYRKEQVTGLASHFSDWSNKDLAVSVCVALMDLLPPSKNA